MKVLGVQLGDTVDQIRSLFPATKFREPGRTDASEVGAFLGFYKTENQRLDFGFDSDGTLIRMIARVQLPEGRTVHHFLESLREKYGAPSYAEGRYDRRLQYRQIDERLREIANLSISVFQPRYPYRERIARRKRPWIFLNLTDLERTRAHIADESRREERRKGQI